MIDATRATRRAYAEEANRYCHLTQTYERFPGLEAEVRRFHDATPPGPILDAGCGAGRDASLLARLGRLSIAMDVTEPLLRCIPRIDDQAVSRRKVVVLLGDLLSIPLLDAAVSGVWMCGSLLHLPRRMHASAIHEARRVLAPGGLLAVSMKAGEADSLQSQGSILGERWLAEVDPSRFAEQLRVAGFADVRIEWSGRGAWFVAVGRR
ncbi:class I SAM-dependent methyltransferase [Blastococcus sp. SYSU DS0539]